MDWYESIHVGNHVYLMQCKICWALTANEYYAKKHFESHGIA